MNIKVRYFASMRDREAVVAMIAEEIRERQFADVLRLEAESTMPEQVRTLLMRELELDPADAEAMMDAWENGGEKGFMDWATGHWGNEYLDDWKFDAVDGIDIERPYGGGWR